MSRLEYALRTCVNPGVTVEFICVNRKHAKAIFERMCELIPINLIARWGLSHVEFSNGSKISVSVSDRKVLLPNQEIEMRVKRPRKKVYAN